MSTPPPSVDAMTWWMYVGKRSNGANNVQIAKAVGITPSSVGRWSRGSNPDPAQAAAFARSYGRPVLEAFVAAGFLTPEEAGETPSEPPSLAELDDDTLLDEVRRRMQGGSSDGWTPEAEKSDDQVGEGARLAITRQGDLTLAAMDDGYYATMKDQAATDGRRGEESQDTGGMEPA